MKKSILIIMVCTVASILGITYAINECGVDKAIGSIAVIMVFILAFALITIIETKPTPED